LKADDYTRIGKSGGRFPTTHWTALAEVRPGDEARNRFLIGELIGEYWRPVYCYLRRKGYDNEAAKDLTQGFFQEVVLGRELIQRADPEKGRLRTLVLTALDRYVANVHRARTAQKRIPPEKLTPLDEIGRCDVPAAAADFSCEESFNYAWVSALLDKMLQEVEADCCRRGMVTHWYLFRDRVVRPIVEDRDPPSLPELCARYGVKEATKASNMIFAVKRRLRATLEQHVRQSVASDAEAAAEVAELAQFLTGR
jgi:RNA polymerase sigma-70 factor (ECF subfamily)